jgi:hypothetical protein
MLEVFKQLIIRGDPPNLSRLMDEIAGHPATGWRHNRDREPRNMPKLGAGYGIAVFRWEGSNVAPAADLYMKGRGEILEVTNIVPAHIPKLSYAQYNSIISNFASTNILPRQEFLRLKIEETPDRLPITHWLTEEAASRLTAFSNSANRSIPHALDRERWRAFLIKVHFDQTTLDTETLFRWLTEEEGWPEEAAEPLIIQFEFAFELLDDYDKKYSDRLHRGC